MAIFCQLFKFNLKVVYFILKLFPIKKNKIVFISRQSNNPSFDFLMLKNELLKINSNFEIVIITKKIEKGFKNYISYYFNLYKQMYHLSTSKVCIVDSYCIPVSILKHKKDLKIIQIWHAMGAIKKFGYQSLGKKDGRDLKLAKLMKMHENYDYVVSGSDVMIKYFSEAFNVDRDKFIVNGMPKMDYIFENKKVIKNKILNQYKFLKEKKNVLYAPTFRAKEENKFDDLVKNFDYKNFNLIVKLHPKCPKIDNDKILTCDDFSSLELLTIADYLITDYSAISIEAAVLNIPIILYLYDYDEYLHNNGLNIDLFEELSPYVYKDYKKVIEALENKYNKKIILKFKNKYCDSDVGNYTLKLADFINKRMIEDD